MKINDSVLVKTDGEQMRKGIIRLIEPFNEGIMYLIELPEYPTGIWFFYENTASEGIYVIPKESD
ncbi:protein DsrB [Candidatus Arsenophonus triatominarum]|uniref:protein DsrB n=1 Tax=Candidatus Arsenophonus triatominarum TaxID=57911 RepID=UPI0007C48C9E|nr:protein DsrB [Candidatus Arsenophonus triatominarum]